MPKLRVNISDPSLIEEAKAYAKEKGVSLSYLVENHLRNLRKKSALGSFEIIYPTLVLDSLSRVDESTSKK